MSSNFELLKASAWDAKKDELVAAALSEITPIVETVGTLPELNAIVDAAELAAQQSAASAPWNYPTLTGAGGLLAETQTLPNGTRWTVRGLGEWIVDSTAPRPDAVAAGGTKFLAAGPVLTPEMFWREGDGVDWLAAMQRMQNAALRLGGARCEYKEPYYFCEIFTPAQVDRSLWHYNNAPCSVLYFAPETDNVSVCGGTDIDLTGGSTSAWGYSIPAYGLITNEPRDMASVLAADSATRSVTVSATNLFEAGDHVKLYRRGGSFLGTTGVNVQRTPSQEQTPCQFLTVKTVDAETNTITFVEPFRHFFDSRQDLELSKQKTRTRHTANVNFHGINFPGQALFYADCAGGTVGDLSGTVIMASSQDLTIGSIKSNKYVLGFEGASGLRVGSMEGNYSGDGTTLAVLINDNAKDFQIGRMVMRGYKMGGAWMNYAQGSVDYCHLNDCGDANYEALRVGNMIGGNYPTSEVINATGFLRRNAGDGGAVRFGTLIIDGPGGVKRPIYVSDANFTAGTMTVHLDEASGYPIFHVGDSGTHFNDSVWCTDYKTSKISVDSLNIVTNDPDAVVSADKIFRFDAYATWLKKAPEAYVAVAAAAGATSLVLDTVAPFYEYATNMQFANPASTSNSSINRQITGVDRATNTLTLGSGLPADLPVGHPVWITDGRTARARAIRIRNITVNGKLRADLTPYAVMYASTTLSTPAEVKLPCPEGSSTLIVRVTPQAGTLASRWETRWSVVNSGVDQYAYKTFDAGPVSSPVKSAGISIASGVATVTITTTAASTGTRIEYAWV